MSPILTPEQSARENIDALLARCGWTVQDKLLDELKTVLAA